MDVSILSITPSLKPTVSRKSLIKVIWLSFFSFVGNFFVNFPVLVQNYFPVWKVIFLFESLNLNFSLLSWIWFLDWIGFWRWKHTFLKIKLFLISKILCICSGLIWYTHSKVKKNIPKILKNRKILNIDEIKIKDI